MLLQSRSAGFRNLLIMVSVTSAPILVVCRALVTLVLAMRCVSRSMMVGIPIPPWKGLFSFFFFCSLFEPIIKIYTKSEVHGSSSSTLFSIMQIPKAREGSRTDILRQKLQLVGSLYNHEATVTDRRMLCSWSRI